MDKRNPTTKQQAAMRRLANHAWAAWKVDLLIERAIARALDALRRGAMDPDEE